MSDVINIKTAIEKDPSNKATIEFERSLATKSDGTVDLIEDAIYIIYLSWGIFENSAATADGENIVRGDTIVSQLDNKKIQKLMEFPIEDAPPEKCSGGTKGIMAGFSHIAMVSSLLMILNSM